MLITLQSLKHKYEQTPRFFLSNESDERAPVHLELTIQEGKVVRGSLSTREPSDMTTLTFEVGEQSSRPKLHEIGSSTVDEEGNEVTWESVLSTGLRGIDSDDQRYLLSWLRRIMPA